MMNKIKSQLLKIIEKIDDPIHNDDSNELFLSDGQMLDEVYEELKSIVKEL